MHPPSTGLGIGSSDVVQPQAPPYDLLVDQTAGSHLVVSPSDIGTGNNRIALN